MYGLELRYIYEGGVFSPEVLKITDDVLMGRWCSGLGNVAAVCLSLGILNEVSLPHHVLNGFNNVVALSLELEYLHFEQVQKVKAFLDDPSAFACAAPSGGGGGGGAAKAPAAKAPEPEPEEEEEDMGFDLFD
jgi:large subunit ribosomal protein LP0